VVVELYMECIMLNVGSWNRIRVRDISFQYFHFHSLELYVCLPVYRKAVRATLVLFPLFGLHFGITIYRPKSTCKWMEIYLLVNDVLDGFQGFIVALIFCYLNGEVGTNCTRKFLLFIKLHFKTTIRQLTISSK